MRLSAYTICLNEEECIPQALAYASTIADEIIIVDGGSTDGTVFQVLEFARHHPHVPIVLSEHPMPDSFSEQRNFAIERCSGDWILHLDADEKYSRGLAELVLALDSVPQNIVGYSFPTWHLAEDERHYQNGDADPHVRLFRNRADIRYANQVHEHVALNGQILIGHPFHFGELEREHVLYWDAVHLLHYGSLRSDKAYAAWYERWQRFAARSAEAGINVDALVRHPKAIGEIPEGELPE